MKTICESPITTLQIIKPDIIKRYYEIKSGDDQYGSLDIMHAAGTLARIETHQGSFTVKRAGFFRPYITLRKDKFELNEAFAFLDIEKGTKIVLNKNAYYFKIINLWKNQWGWTNEKNQLILRYKPTIAGMVKGDVEFSKEFTYLENLEIIAMLGIYFLVQYEEEIMKVGEM
ncbi:MAG: hypothetical protein RR356_05420 [Bacteroidales bacterium]